MQQRAKEVEDTTATLTESLSKSDQTHRTLLSEAKRDLKTHLSDLENKILRFATSEDLQQLEGLFKSDVSALGERVKSLKSQWYLAALIG